MLLSSIKSSISDVTADLYPPINDDIDFGFRWVIRFSPVFAGFRMWRRTAVRLYVETAVVETAVVETAVVETAVVGKTVVGKTVVGTTVVGTTVVGTV